MGYDGNEYWPTVVRQGGAVLQHTNGATNRFMCGLWASIGLPELPRALSLVAHRGPDGACWRQWPGPHGEIRLAHRRLAIQDSSARANQPFADRSLRRWLSFNGEILNFRALREELVVETGLRFTTDSDTEVLLEWICCKGLAGLERLRGFFAFVLVDHERQCLIAARDRYGIKPLYHTSSRPGVAAPWLAFASEIKQFTAVPGAVDRLDRLALRDYMTWGLFDHTNGTFFEHIHQLPPGHAAIVDLSRPIGSSNLSIFRWAQPLQPTSCSADADHGAGALLEAIDQGVQLNLCADTELAVALSGGLDSATICARASAHWPMARGPLKAFGVMFPDIGYAEAQHAVAVARHCAIDLDTTTLNAARLQECFERVVWHFDEPVVVPNMLAQHAVFELVGHRGVRVMLTGQGGDELLCGYPSMYGMALLDILQRSGPLRAAAELRSVLLAGVSLSEIGRSLFSGIAPRAMLRAAARGFGPGAASWQRHCAQLVEPLVARSSLGPDRASTSAGLLASLCHALMGSGNLRMLLHFEDRNSMAFGVETRPVMVDAEIERFCLGVPAVLKLRNGRSKWLLREAMRGSLPSSVVDRQDKLGFPIPDRLWREGAFHTYLCRNAAAALHECAHLLDDLLDVRHAAAALRAGESRSLPLWVLASLGAWMQRFGVRAA